MKRVKLLIKCHISLRLHITLQIVSCHSHAYSLSDRSTGLKHDWKKKIHSKTNKQKAISNKICDFPLNPVPLKTLNIA